MTTTKNEDEQADAATGLSGADASFTAYDCSQPADLKTLSVRPHRSCKESLKTATPLKEAKFRVLQKVTRVRFAIVECKVEQSRLAYHCSPSTGHSSLFPPDFRFSKMFVTTPETCWEAVKTGFWKHEVRYQTHQDNALKPARRYSKQPIRINGTVYHRVDVAGDYWEDHGDVQCRGESVYLGERTDIGYTKNMVLVDHYKVTVNHREAFVDNDSGRIIIPTLSLELPATCVAAGGSCITQDHGTFTWNYDEIERDSCPYFSARLVSGVEVEDKSENTVEGTDEPFSESGKTTVFLSEAKAMLRIRVKHPALRVCGGGKVFETEHPDFVLTRQVDHPKFARPLHQSEFSILSYVNMQDAFIYHEVLDNVATLASRWRHEQCEKRAASASIAFARKAAEQQAVADGETAALGDGQFITAAGEAWYHFSCKEITVKAKLIDNICYDALPIELSARDLRARTKALHGTGLRSESEQPLFLEPRSRRITTEAAPLDCAHPMPPLYQNIRGSWVAYRGNGVHLTQTPKVLEDLAPKLLDDTSRKNFAWHDGGLYSYQDTKRMEAFNQAPRRFRAMERSLTNNIQPGSFVRRPEAHTLFNDIPDTATLTAMGFLGKLWRAIEAYGRICSVIVATGLIIKFIGWVAGIFLRLLATPVTDSVILHVLSAFFPALGDYLLRGRRPGGLFATCFGNRPRPARGHGADAPLAPTGTAGVSPGATAPVYPMSQLQAAKSGYSQVATDEPTQAK